MDFIDEELYFEALNFANELVNIVSDCYSKPIELIKCFDIQNYVTDVKHIEIINYKFKKQLQYRMLGSTSKILGEIIITINDNLMLERKNFTTMHEVVHLFLDIPHAKEGYSFSDIVSENGYLPPDLPKEHRANFGASFLMANDIALGFALKKFKNFKEVADYFYMSKSALHNRLRYHLIFVKKCSPSYTQHLTNTYRFSNKKDLLSLFD